MRLIARKVVAVLHDDEHGVVERHSWPSGSVDWWSLDGVVYGVTGDAKKELEGRFQKWLKTNSLSNHTSQSK